MPRPRSRGSYATRRPDPIRLTGPSLRLDPRTHAYRRDIADIALAGRLFAPHYADPVARAIVVDQVTLALSPDPASPAGSQLLRGEHFHVVDVAGDRAWGRCGHDDYVGYLPLGALGPIEPATHRIAVPVGLVFARPDIKAPVADRWPIGARLSGTRAGDFLETSQGWVHRAHAVAIGDSIEPAALAERLIGQPYLWGGRGGGGIDCSGLVQQALSFAGIAAPRDSDLQCAALGEVLTDGAALRRGDLVFFPGHVGIMADAERMIHANAFAMAVTVEPLAAVVARLAPANDQPILGVRRLP